MPKSVLHALIWSSESHAYALYDSGQSHHTLCLPEDEGAWQSWLTAHHSFSFQSRYGRLSLLKETRARGSEGYWYAYHRQGQRRTKQYAGRTSDLTIARLEELAYLLTLRIKETSQSVQRGCTARQVVSHRQREYGACTPGSVEPFQQSLLLSRLSPPPLQRALLPRKRLLELLDAGLERKLTLLAAPTGFGKTTLLAQWFARHPQQVVWLSLDREQNDPPRFLTYLIGAWQRVFPNLGRSMQTFLQEQRETLLCEQAVLNESIILLLNELAALPTEMTIVLDNYHLIENQDIHTLLKQLLADLPAHVHLVLASRCEPPGLLTRLRASGELLELGTSALRLTRKELEELLTSVLHLKPEPEDLDALEERSGGWLAGLYLAQSAQPGQANVASLCAACAGTNRHIQAYFLEEVLADLPSATQTFLLHTALLERCNAALCAAVTGQEQAACLLEELARAQIFLSPLPGQEDWYRYHPLFASALRQHLRRTHPEFASMLHRRAGQWFEAHNLLTEAVEHALAAHEYTHAATLIEKIAPALISEGKIPVLQSWLDALPETIVRSSPHLCISRVWIIFITSRPDTFILWVEAAQEALYRLEETLPPPTLVALQSEILALRSVYTISFADFAEAISACQQALQQLPPENYYLRGLILMLLGFAYTRSTDVGAAAQALFEARNNIRVTGHALLLPYVIGAQAELYMVQGYPFQAAQLYRSILTLATEQNLSSLFAAGFAHLGLGYLLWGWNTLAEARYHLLQAWHMAQRTQTGTTLFQSALLLALVAQAQGDSAATQFWQQQAESLSRRRNYAEAADTIAAVRARFALKEGRLEETMLWVREQSQRNTDPGYKRDEFVDFTLARALIAAGQAGIDGIRACEPLEYWRLSADQAGRVSVLLEALVLQALTFQFQGDYTGALHALQRAVTLAEPGRYIRLFVDEGDPMARLLRQLLEQQRARNASNRPNNVAYLCTLLKAFAQPATFALPLSPTKAQPLFDPLSLREREVLNLIAAGRKNREIADELVVVTGTVKAHINMIYQKLGVTNRVQAITRARSLGLLS